MCDIYKYYTYKDNYNFLFTKKKSYFCISKTVVSNTN